MQREIQFLDLGDLELNRRLNELFVSITKAFSRDQYSREQKGRVDTIFRLFNGEQRAIGEIMMMPRSTDQKSGYECIGYAAFVKRMSDPDFSRWFMKLKEDMKVLINGSRDGEERLDLIHSRLIDLIDFLDQNCLRVQTEYRTRIK